MRNGCILLVDVSNNANANRGNLKMPATKKPEWKIYQESKFMSMDIISQTLEGKEVVLIPNINKFLGQIPSGYDLIAYEQGEEKYLNTAEGMHKNQLMIYGFNEVGLFTHEFVSIQYAFVKN